MKKAPGWLLATMMMLNSGVGRADEKTPEVDNLTVAASSWKEKKFTGSPISLNLKDADVLDVFRLIGETSGFNVVVHPNVTGKITVALDDVPWDQALEVILSTLRLGAERAQSVLRIMPRDLLIAEAQANLDAQKAAVKSAPKYTRIFPISYTDLPRIQSLIQSYTGAQSSDSAAATDPSAPLLIPDSNTQSLIVRDTAEGLDRIKKLIQILDVQTPQIVIDAKVIDATETFSRSIEGKIAFGSGDYTKSMNFNGGTLPLAGPATPLQVPSGTNAVKFSVGGSNLLNALLTYSEGDSKAKVISSPRVLVLSGKSATINQTSNISIESSTISNGVTTITRAFTPVPTTLTVTPRATNEGAVFMTLSLTRSVAQTDPSGQVSPATRTINTDVIVDSGNTLVLGGVQSMSETEASTGMPFLRRIPLIGWLFGKELSGNEKSELMFFVTPRILNMKRAGMTESAQAGEAEKKSNL